MRAGRLAIAGVFVVAMFAAGSSAFGQANGLSYCKSDMERLCPGVQPGGGRIIGCLKEHKMELSVGCAKALQKMKGSMGK